MGESIEQFIARRRLELENEAGSLRGQLAAIADEHQKLDLAATAVGASVFVSVAEKTFAPQNMKRVRNAKIGGIGKIQTMKNCILAILANHPQGLSALEIMPILNRELGSDYERSSISPQLSRLKGDGLIDLKAGIWTLSETVSAHIPSRESGMETPGDDTPGPINESN